MQVEQRQQHRRVKDPNLGPFFYVPLPRLLSVMVWDPGQLAKMFWRFPETS